MAQVLSTPWADCTVVLSAKVNCCPWVTVHFALGTTVLITSISLGIHMHIDTELYFKHNNFMVKSIWKHKQTVFFIFRYINFKTEVCTVGFASGNRPFFQTPLYPSSQIVSPVTLVISHYLYNNIIFLIYL